MDNVLKGIELTKFGERLRTRRRGRFSQEKLAEMINVHNNTISRMENGTSQPDFEQLYDLSKALDTTIAYLLGEIDDPSPTALSALTSQSINASGATVNAPMANVANAGNVDMRASAPDSPATSKPDDKKLPLWFQVIPMAYQLAKHGDRQDRYVAEGCFRMATETLERAREEEAQVEA